MGYFHELMPVSKVDIASVPILQMSKIKPRSNFPKVIYTQMKVKKYSSK